MSKATLGRESELLDSSRVGRGGAPAYFLFVWGILEETTANLPSPQPIPMRFAGFAVIEESE